MPFDIFVCATGPKRTVGRFGFLPMLSVMGWLAKGRTLGTGTVLLPGSRSALVGTTVATDVECTDITAMQNGWQIT